MSRQLAVRNPRTGQADYTAQAADAAELAAVVAELREAQPAWASAGAPHRCKVVMDWAEALLADPQPVVAALTTDTGRHLISVVEVQGLRAMIARACGAAPKIFADGGEHASTTEGVGVRNQLIPYEVVGVISPWNFPFLLSMIDAIPALIAGCSVIVKPSEVTPRFIEPLQDSLRGHPELAAVFQWVAGDGETGAAMTEHVDAIAFTGSVATGRLVAEACARNFIPAFLELGGKDPAIVLPSADMDQAARIILRASVQATGQACQSLERVYVPRERENEFVDKLVARAERVELNYPDINKGHIGPLIFARQGDIIRDHIADAVQKGATVRCGGQIETHGGGTWVRPTVLTGVDHSMQVMRDETFGPIVPVMAYDSIEHAIELANDTRYGLSAAVFGADLEQAEAIARRIDAGAVSINDGGMTTDVHDAEHDSFRLSGMGASRMGDSGVTRFMRRKAVLIRHAEAKDIDSLDERLMSAAES